ncbi:hypothetical protein BGW41_006726 [Actinomortierella wolfii]|nr:hypothetical protein BGW41_006726 [Actinomortierella wolfii]
MSSYRVVHMLYQTDADLFDAIKEWKEAHPDRWVDDAIDAFASAKGADALAHLVYSTEAFDIVLKYTASKQDIAPIFNGYKSNKQQSQRTPTSPTALSPISPDNMTPMENVDQISPPKLVDKEKERVVIGIHQDRVPTGEPLQRDTSKSLRSRSRLFELRESPKQLLRRALSLQSSTIVKHWRLPATSITAEQTKQGGVLHPLPRSESSAPKVLFSSEDAPPKPLGIPPIPKMEPLELPGSENVEIHPYIVPTKTTSTGMKALDNACISFQDIVYGPMNEAEALAKGVIKPHQPQEDDIQPLPSFKSQLESEKCSNPSGGGASSSTTRPAIPPRKGSGYSAAGTSASSRRRKSKKKRRTKIRRERPSKAKMREWKIQLHRRQYQLALLREGLFIELEKSIHSDAVYVKVLAPFWRLVDEAQKTMCKADLANTMLPSIPFASRLFPNIGRLFPCLLKSGLEQHRESVLFKKSRLHEYYLAEMNRRWSDVVRHSGALGPTGKHIGNNHGSDGRPGFFMTSRRGYLVHSIMMRTESQNVTNNRKLGLRSALRRGAYQKLFALHDGPFKLKHRPTNEVNVRAQLHHKWAKRFCGNHPLDTVVSYYGERIGVYFAWWAHYTRWLTIPAAVGLMVFVFGIINAANQNRLDVSPNVLFAIFDNVLTMPFALFMSLWSTIYIEFWKRANKFYAYRWHMLDYERVELPRTEFRATRVRTSPVTGKKELYYPSYWKLLRIMGSSAATVMAFGTKVFPLNPDLQDKCLYDACITELSVQLAVVFIGKQFLNGMFEMVFPYLIQRFHLTSVIQFGFCTLFVTSFPVAPAFALINNLIDLRMEAFRLLTQYRRPIAFRAQDIGVWEKIMEFISFTSVITNAAIIAFSSLWVKQNIFVDYLHATTEGELLAARLGFILVFEHVVFLFKVILRSAIPTVPLPIKLAVQRSKYMNRVAQEGLDSEQDEDLDETDSEEDEEDEYLSDGEMSDTENDDDDEDNGDDDESDQSSVVSGEDGSDTFESSNRFFDPECPECVSSSSMPTGPRTTTAVGDDGPRTLQPSDNKAEERSLTAEDQQPQGSTTIDSDWMVLDNLNQLV